MRWLALVLLVACSGDKGKVQPTGDTGAGDDDDVACNNAILGSYPGADATDVYPWSAMDVSLSQPDADATIEVRTSGGDVVAGTVGRFDNDRRLEWLPDAPMSSGDYTYDLVWGCETRTTSFQVDDGPTTPTGDPAGLVGKTYVLDLKQSRFVAPQGIGPALESTLEVKLLLGIVSADATGVQLLAGAEAQEGGQDLGASTTSFTNVADFSDPRFSVAQAALPLVVEGDPITVTDLNISGSFTADGSSIQGFRMSTILDTRDLKDALGQPNDDGPCNLFSASFGVQCEACPDGEGEFCINLVVADLVLPDAGYSMVEVP
jgi:hypothetical protein